MMKRLFFILFAFSLLLSAESLRIRTVERAPTKQEAIENAHWIIFEQALNKVLGASSYVGNVKQSFKDDMQKDFLGFQRKYFRNLIIKCNKLSEGGDECLVVASINLDKLKAIVGEKSNSSTTMGRHRVGKIQMVLIDNVANKLSHNFITQLQASVNDNGDRLRVEKKGTPVGKKGNKCSEIERERAIYAKKGKSYRAALRAIEKRLKQCRENQNVKYLFNLTDITFHLLGKDSYGNATGELSYTMNMVNTQTGRVDNAIRSGIKESFAPTKEQLIYKLCKIAANEASKEMTNNILKGVREKNREKSFSKLDKFKYNYTVILSGITYDAKNRKKLKMLKNVVKQFGAKARRNSIESKDFEQVYNFGTNDDIDTDDFTFALYDMAKSMGFNIEVTDKGNNIFVITFR